jgi:hypothetical protein
LERITQQLEEIKHLSPSRLEAYRNRLHERVRSLLGGIDVDPSASNRRSPCWRTDGHHRGDRTGGEPSRPIPDRKSRGTGWAKMDFCFRR